MAANVFQGLQHLGERAVRGATAERDNDIALGWLTAPAHLAKMDRPAPDEAAPASPVMHLRPVAANLHLLSVPCSAPVQPDGNRQFKCHLPIVLPYSVPRIP